MVPGAKATIEVGSIWEYYDWGGVHWYTVEVVTSNSNLIDIKYLWYLNSPESTGKIDKAPISLFNKDLKLKKAYSVQKDLNKLLE